MQYQKIWDKFLNDHEKVEVEFSVSDRFRRVKLVVWCVIGAIFFLAGNKTSQVISVYIFAIAIFRYGFYLKAANAYAFTNKRVLIHKGWLSTKLVSVDFVKITDVTTEESFFARKLYQAGNLKINTAGSSAMEVVLEDVPEPYQLLKKLDALRKD